MSEERRGSDGDLTATELADAVWLASLAERHGGLPGHPSGESAQPPPEAPSDDSVAPAPRHAVPTAEPGPWEPPTASAADSPPSFRATSAAPRDLRPPNGTGLADGGLADGDWSTPQTGLPDLADPLALARALRPLRARHGTRGTEYVFDEQATAERVAHADLWLPVLRPRRDQRRAEAVVVVDDGPSMVLWRKVAQDFVGLLSSLGAFRGVRVVRLDTGPAEDGATASGPTLRAGDQTLSPDALVNAGSDQLVLVLTDGLAPAWRTGMMAPLLHRLGRSHLIAVLHMLPSRSWWFTGVTTTRLTWQGGAPPRHNRDLARSHQPPSSHRGTDALPVPVLALEPRGLHRWARLVGGRGNTGGAGLPVMMTAPPGGAVTVTAAPPSAEPPATARETVARARAFLSPSALRLAVRLAAVPTTDLPIVRRVQLDLAPGSPPNLLSELVASGLLRHMPGPRHPSPDHFPFDFHDGVREELLALTTRQDTWDVIHLLGRTVPTGRWSQGQRFLMDSLGGLAPETPVVTATDEPSLTVAAAVLRALSGPYRGSAQRLHSALADHAGDTAAAGPEAGAARSVPPAPDETNASPRDPVDLDAPAAAEPGHLLPASADSAAEPTTPVSARPTTIWGRVPPRNVHFTGREEELSLLRGRLAAGAAEGATLALTGLGGLGKSQLALEYVYRYCGQADLVWWVRADDPASVTRDFHDLGREMGLRLPADAPVTDAVPLVLEALRAGEVRRRWLLVFDSAESVQDIRPFLPLGGPGAVLITARTRQWSHVTHSLEVGVFTREESVALLRRRNPHLEADEADRIAEALGDLPLALEQASVWLGDTGMPVNEYLYLLRIRFLELLDESPYDYPLAVTSVWGLALERLGTANPAALNLLRVIACLAPEPVPVSLFRSGAGASESLAHPAGDPLRLARALRDISRHSLLRLDHHADTLQIHQLVAKVLRSQASPAELEEARRVAGRLLAHLPAGRSRTAHLLACHAVESKDEQVRATVLDQLRRLAEHGEDRDRRLLAEAARAAGWLVDAEAAEPAEPGTPAELAGLAEPAEPAGLHHHLPDEDDLTK